MIVLLWQYFQWTILHRPTPKEVDSSSLESFQTSFTNSQMFSSPTFLSKNAQLSDRSILATGKLNNSSQKYQLIRLLDQPTLPHFLAWIIDSSYPEFQCPPDCHGLSRHRKSVRPCFALFTSGLNWDLTFLIAFKPSTLTDACLSPAILTREVPLVTVYSPWV